MQINQLPSASSLNLQDKFAVDATDGVTKSITASQLRDLIRTNSYGAPLEASTVTAMTDTSKVYVYTGNETGYVNGNWYYYNGTAWVSGGVYNSVAVNTDTTLTLSGVAADARATGTAIQGVATQVTSVEGDLQQEIDNIFSDLATAYEALTFPVSEGQYCVRAERVYKANQDISTPEAWNSSHWTLTNLGEGLSNLSDVQGDIANLNAAIVTERLARQTADTSLNNAISAEATAREQAVTAEASAREAADTALSASITAEQSAREAAVTAEATAREAADNELKGDINDLQGAIVTERLARQTADNALTGSINTEIAAREAADTALSSDISAEATAREAADDELKSAISDCFNAFPTDNVNGAVAHYSDGADAPIKSLVAVIKPIQPGNGDPSAENTRPIIGWDKIVIARTGQNMLTNCRSILPVTINGITWSDSGDEKIIANGTATADSSIAFNFTTNTEIIPQGAYVYGGCPDGGGAETYNVFVWDNTDNKRPQRGESDTRASINVTNSTETGTFYVPHGHAIRVQLRIMSGVTVSNLVFSPFVVITGQNAAWASPTSDTVPINFSTSAGTVYGGTVDVIAGILTVTHKIYTFNGNENWGSPQTDARFEASVTIQDTILSWNNGGRGLSNIGIYTNNDKSADVSYITSRSNIGSNGKQHTLVFPLSIAASVSEAKAFLAAHNEQWYAPLAEPITYQLSPAVVNSLYGENNVFVDAGNVSVEYRADTSMYINRKISEAIAALETT